MVTWQWLLPILIVAYYIVLLIMVFSFKRSGFYDD